VRADVVIDLTEAIVADTVSGFPRERIKIRSELLHKTPFIL
jgi:hypothetical protein